MERRIIDHDVLSARLKQRSKAIDLSQELTKSDKDYLWDDSYQFQGNEYVIEYTFKSGKWRVWKSTEKSAIVLANTSEYIEWCEAELLANKSVMLNVQKTKHALNDIMRNVRHMAIDSDTIAWLNDTLCKITRAEVGN